MKCRKFQKLIPKILLNRVQDEELKEVIDHVENCKDCYDELEIHYILRYGLGDDDSKESMDFIGQLERNIDNMKTRYKRFEYLHSIYMFVQVSAYTAVIGSFIYFFFKILI